MEKVGGGKGGERRLWECGKPVGFSIISMAGAKGEKGEVTFSLSRRRRRSFAPPFSPFYCPKGILIFLFASFSLPV